jgi:hydrogenase maturation protease
VTGLRIIAMGNECMGDDGVGLRVLALLREQRERGALGPAAELVEAGQDASLVAASLAEGTRVLLVDAVEMGGRPGEWKVFTADEAAGGNGRDCPASTHGVSVSTAAGIAIALGCAANLRILGIQAGAMRQGSALSPEVVAGLPGVLRAIREEAEVMT